jgi:hypothetical protein
MNEEARALEFADSCILFFKLVLRTLGPEYLRHFLALFGFVAQPKLLFAWNLYHRNSTSIP